MSDEAVLLEVDTISLSFSGIRALDEVSLTLESGQLGAVIGPNGAGKTSMFNCISGLYTPQSGDVRFRGESVLGLASHEIAERGVARMFQNLARFDQLTVLENITLGRHHLMPNSWWANLLWFGPAKRAEIDHRTRVEEIIEFLDLENYRKMPCGVLPYGILKRVELGRALAMEPELLLLDEPAAGLNQEETEDMARYILDIKEELGTTQLLIEHELHLVLDLADQITVLDFGHRIAHGPPAEVRRDPRVLEAYVGAELQDTLTTGEEQ